MVNKIKAAYEQEKCMDRFCKNSTEVVVITLTLLLWIILAVLFFVTVYYAISIGW